MEELIYSYRGYEYRPETDIEEDNYKMFHHIYREDGSGYVAWMPLSPYSFPSREFFEAYVDAGFPTENRRPTLRELQDIAFNNLFEAACVAVGESND